MDDYRAGATARELAERYSVSESSVKRLGRQAGADVQCLRDSTP